MEGKSGPRRATSEWLRPRAESQGIARYLGIVRERWLLVVATTLLAIAAAFAYVTLTAKVYEATADLLVTPVSSSDASTSGLGLIGDSNDPTRDVSTAAKLVTTPQVAALVKRRLRLPGTTDEILADITAEPIAQSNLVAVTAKDGTAAGSAALANAFARASVDVRTAQLHRQINTLLPRLRTRLQGLPPDEQTGPGSLGERIADLEALRAGSDPTIRVATPATPPASPSSPKKKLALIAGALAGLVIGLGAAFATQALDPRLRREEQLREIFRLPILARVPRQPRSRNQGPLAPDELSVAAAESYRTLRATLAATLGDESRSVLVTGSSPGEGKTTTAINYAFSLAQAGHSVILIEGDMRRPTVGWALGVRPVVGIGAVLINQASLEDALVTTEASGGNLRLLLVERAAGSLADRLSLPTARQIIREAEALADYVVVDSPPLTEVIDALPLAQEVGAVLIMARLGTSRLHKLNQLGEILAQGGVTPAGIALVGVDRAAESSYYVQAPAGNEPVRS